MPTTTTRHFDHNGHRLAYAELGAGDRVAVLLHGLLLSKRMHRALACELAARDLRVVSLDFLGHGESDKPTDMTQHSMQLYATQAIALLDHLGVEQAVFLGTSLGANAALEAAVIAPERMRGMVLEMPVLDNAIIGAGVAFLPVMLAMRFATPLMQLSSAITRRLPTRPLGVINDTVLDWARDEPLPSLAVLQGLFFGRLAPPRSVRRTLTPPALVIGHHNDPIHPLTDAGALAEELPDARLLQADSILELRVRPARLTAEIAAFIEECFARRPRADGAQRSRTAGGRSAA